MIANILDVDTAITEAAFGGGEATAIFYDFAAAFPSIEQKLFHEFFQSLGWPLWLRRFVEALYRSNFCQIVMGGARYEGFTITRGIRQGCPLSPLLFAIVTDLFLRGLRRRFPSSSMRAWADDLAMIVTILR